MWNTVEVIGWWAWVSVFEFMNTKVKTRFVMCLLPWWERSMLFHSSFGFRSRGKIVTKDGGGVMGVELRGWRCGLRHKPIVSKGGGAFHGQGYCHSIHTPADQPHHPYYTWKYKIVLSCNSKHHSWFSLSFVLSFDYHSRPAALFSNPPYLLDVGLSNVKSSNE